VFVVSLFGALVAIAWHCRGDIREPWLAYGLPSAVIVAVLAYGSLRLASNPDTSAIPVGLIAIDRRAPAPLIAVTADDPVWNEYAGAVPGLAGRGVKIIVLPEKIARLDDAAGDQVRQRLGRLAADNAVYLLAGVALVKSDQRENRAWLFAPNGELIGDYAKHHLITGLEAAFTPGRELVVSSVGSDRLGIAICKDMDFPTLGRSYAKLGVDAMLVPGWDFERDAWWHARMAILRGVESGFAVVRSARNGLLTVSDRYGRVVNVAASGSAPAANLAAPTPIGSREATVYARLGDVFGWLCVVCSTGAWLASLVRRGA
jgi:apolipoprotein N-acyltransferase